MKYYLSINELDTMLNGVIEAANSRSIIFAQFFQNLKNTGLRFSELKHTERWYFDKDLILWVPTLKGGNPRTNMENLITPWLLSHIRTNSNPFLRIDNSTASYWIYSFLPVGNLYHETKVLKTHLFRHLLAKQMHKSGYTYNQIMLFFGEVDLKNILSYIDSEIYYNN